MKSRTLVLRSASTLLVLGGVLLMGVVSGVHADEKDKPKTREVKIKDVTLMVPENWKQTPPSSKLRLAQFSIPPAKGDKEPTEVVVYSFGGGGGGLTQNLPRWIGEFRSQGRTMKITRGKSPQGEYVVVDIQGTHVGPSFRRRKVPLEKARMIAVILEVKNKGNYFLKMTGPEKTITAAAPALRASFGADPKKEEKVDLDEG